MVTVSLLGQGDVAAPKRSSGRKIQLHAAMMVEKRRPKIEQNLALDVGPSGDGTGSESL